MRIVLLAGIVLLGCAGGSDRGKAPTAVLEGPGCVLAGHVAKLDAGASSDPDGEIVRYQFLIDHHAAPVVTSSPVLYYTFDEPLTDKQQIVAYQIVLRVTDDDGNHAWGTLQVPVVREESECPGGTTTEDVVIPQPDVVEPADAEIPDAAGDGAPLPDATEATAVEVLPEVTEDVPPPDFGPADCPDVSGVYTLNVTCLGSPALDMTDLELIQSGCELEDNYGIFYGDVEQDGTVHIATDMPDFYMAECTGVFNPGAEFWSVECSSGCTAVFTLQ